MGEATRKQTDEIHREPRRAISRSIVGLMKEHLGRGPDKAQTYIQDDAIFVLLYGGHTKSEETLRKDGEEEAVAEQRVKSAAAISEELTAVVEAETGRKVVGYMSTSQQDPSLLCHVFVFDSVDETDGSEDD